MRRTQRIEIEHIAVCREFPLIESPVISHAIPTHVKVSSMTFLFQKAFFVVGHPLLELFEPPSCRPRHAGGMTVP